jgi:hypothetical protein
MITTVKNPADKPATLKIYFDQDPQPTSTQPVLPGQTATIRTSLKHSPDSNLCVRYSGEKTLVLLQTEFQ